MTRRPGAPGDYMRLLYSNALTDLRLQPAADKHPEIRVEKAWEQIVKKLIANEYVFDTGFYGSLDDYARKIAYFFHLSLQGVVCFPGAAKALQHVQKTVRIQGLIADGQCFSRLHLDRALATAGCKRRLDELIPTELQVWSFEVKARKPSERPFREMLDRLKRHSISPGQVLHVGGHIFHDVALAKKMGMKTALFAGDRSSIHASKAMLRRPETRPDVLLTQLPQIAEVVGEV
jgi:FMN phosphatase YigB (HAD superfamily)